MAAKKGLLDIAKHLITMGAYISDYINLQDKDNNTPLYLAIINSHNKIEKFLIDNYAATDIKNSAGKTATDLINDKHLITVVKRNNLEKLEILIGKDKDKVDTRDQYRATLLHHAAMYGYLEIAQFLIKNGANINAQDKQKLTPLHWAIQKAHAEMALKLINSGAKTDIKDFRGKTAMDLIESLTDENDKKTLKDAVNLKAERERPKEEIPETTKSKEEEEVTKKESEEPEEMGAKHNWRKPLTIAAATALAAAAAYAYYKGSFKDFKEAFRQIPEKHIPAFMNMVHRAIAQLARFRPWKAGSN